MKSKLHYSIIALSLVALATLNSHLAISRAQGTAFTYQGHLSSGGNPANGLYDFRFKLALDPLADNYAGADFLTNGIPVTNGLFTTTVDFGAGLFTGTNYWLEVDVRTNNPANTLAYITLSPLQGVTPAPYAIMANSASNLLGELPVADLSGTVPLSQLPTAVVTNDETGVILSEVTVNGSLDLPATASIYSGPYSLLYADGSSDLFNLFVGLDAGNPYTSGFDNTAIGNETLDYNTIGDYNTALGIGALLSNTSGDYNTALGPDALYANTNGGANIAIGMGTLELNTSGNNNVAAGYYAQYDNRSGSDNVAEGYQALEDSTGDSQLVAVGFEALENDGANNQGTASGFGDNTAVGFQSLLANTIGVQNTAEGYESLASNTNGDFNTASGCFALNSNTSGVGNTADGNDALEFTTSGSANTAIGFNTMHHNATGSDNEACGYAALPYNTIGFYNTANGVNALYENISGPGNVAEGFQTLYNVTNGNFNIALGYQAGGAFTGSESYNIDIGNGGVAGESGVIRIGSFGQQNTAYISGNVGLGGATPQQTLSINGGMNIDQSGLNVGSSANALTFGSSSGEGIGSNRTSGKSDSFGLNFYTDFDKRMTIVQDGNVGIANTNPTALLVVGASASPAYCNGTTWVNGSDRNSKEAFKTINARAVLEKVSALPITEWKYKVEATGTEHLGPMAQDFHAAFGLNGADDKHISTVDESGVALAAIQGLNQKLEETCAENAKLKQQNDSLAERLNELEATVKQLAASQARPDQSRLFAGMPEH